jgi:signal transduction histidine kinase
MSVKKRLPVVLSLLAQTALGAGFFVERARRRRVEERNEALLRTVPDLVFVMTPDGDFIEYHGSDDAPLFVPPEQFLGRNARQVLPPELAERVLGVFPQVTSSKTPAIVEYSLPICGETRSFEATLTVCDGANVLVAVRDITDRKRADETVRQQGIAMRATTEQVRDLAGRLIAAQEAERARVARELHDDLSQKLALLAIGIDELGGERLPSPDRSNYQRLKEQVAEIATTVHRLSHALHPSRIQALGLVAAIESCCREVSAKGQLSVQFTHAHIPSNIPSDISLCLYRIVQEALSNVVKHSGALAAEVALAREDGHIELRIADSGRGFAADLEHAGLGLISMRERVRSVGGRFVVHSANGSGTRIGVRVPIRWRTHSQQIA